MEPEPYLAVIDPNIGSQTKVEYQVTATDPDTTSSLTFTLLEGNGVGAVQLPVTAISRSLFSCFLAIGPMARVESSQCCFLNVKI